MAQIEIHLPTPGSNGPGQVLVDGIDIARSVLRDRITVDAMDYGAIVTMRVRADKLTIGGIELPTEQADAAPRSLAKRCDCHG